MSQHYCEMDVLILAPGVCQSLDEPCGLPATIRCIGMWLCADHYDENARMMAQLGRTPEGDPTAG